MPTSSQSSPSSGASTPNHGSSWTMPRPSAVSHAVSGLLRRFSTEQSSSSSNTTNSTMHSPAFPLHKTSDANGLSGVYTPPYRTASPFQPPPLYPVNLSGYDKSTPISAKLLTKALAEEIRLLVPPRLQLCENWNLIYSLEEHGVSLGTLYKNCEDLRGLRNGFVLIVRDGEGGLFGAYLTEAPHPSPHYFGTGECFLWRASILSASSMPQLSALPPPPSSDTTHMQRSTTLASPSSSSFKVHSPSVAPAHASNLAPPPHSPNTGASTPDRIRFKAFPYSGVNDYLMLCEHGFLSVGGGDGHYGLWLDDSFERGASILSASSMPQLSALPPPPSSDTTHMQRSTTLASPSSSSFKVHSPSVAPAHASNLAPPPHSPNTGASTPDRIRFKAFPYSGVNDYLMLCEHGFLSVGGGDGHYGLWLDDSFERGISSHCLTFGNEPLSDEGEKFDILGVEVWSLGI